jgi:hypothetical protein
MSSAILPNKINEPNAVAEANEVTSSIAKAIVPTMMGVIPRAKNEPWLPQVACN